MVEFGRARVVVERIFDAVVLSTVLRALEEGKAEHIGWEESYKLGRQKPGPVRIVIARAKYKVSGPEVDSETSRAARSAVLARVRRAERGLTLASCDRIVVASFLLVGRR